MNKPFYKIVRLIATGYIFIYFNFTVNGFNIIGRWLAYLFFGRAVKYLQDYNSNSKLLRPLSGVLFVTDFMNEFIKFFGFSSVYSNYILNAAANALFLYLHFAMITDLVKVLDEKGVATKKLLVMRDIITITTTFLTIVILLSKNETFLLCSALACIIISIYFVFSLKQAERRVKTI